MTADMNPFPDIVIGVGRGAEGICVRESAPMGRSAGGTGIGTGGTGIGTRT